MPVITIENLHQMTLEADPERTLLRNLQENRIDWMHACGGKARCTTCKAIVVSGGEELPPATLAEQRYRKAGALKENERLSCQVRVTSDITIRVPAFYKLPHMRYSD